MAIGLILIKAPSPMLIAVGMYLPFYSTAAIFVGGIMRWILDIFLNRRNASEQEKTNAGNIGVLISSGLIAGEALMAVLLALVYGYVQLIGSDFSFSNYGFQSRSIWLGLLGFLGIAYYLIAVPLKRAKS